MMKVMPFVFTLFCYSFSGALSLYSFINGLFTIGQQLVINRMKDAGDVVGRCLVDVAADALVFTTVIGNHGFLCDVKPSASASTSR